MKSCVVYFSRTGNTKKMAEAICESLNAPMYNINNSEPSNLEQFDTLIIGTPVEGFRATKEIMNFIDQISPVENKKAVIFCTYALWKGRTFNNLEKSLSKKGYQVILKVSTKMKKDQKSDFAESIEKIKRTLDN